MIAAFSVGVAEAASGDEEFGEERLIRSLKGQCAAEIVEHVLTGVQHFSSGVQTDELTALVAVGK